MSHFGDNTYLQNIFHTYHWICLVKALLLNSHMTIFEWWFFDQKSGKIDLVNIQKFSIFRFFLSFSNGILQMTPFKSTRRNCSGHVGTWAGCYGQNMLFLNFCSYLEEYSFFGLFENLIQTWVHHFWRKICTFENKIGKLKIRKIALCFPPKLH